MKHGLFWLGGSSRIAACRRWVLQGKDLSNTWNRGPMGRVELWLSQPAHGNTAQGKVFADSVFARYT